MPSGGCSTAERGGGRPRLAPLGVEGASTGELVGRYPGWARADRERFQRVLSVESGRLSNVAEALAGYFEKAHTAARAVTPLDEVEALFQAHGNRFEVIEAAVAPESAADPVAARAAAEARATGAMEAILAGAAEIETATAGERALMQYAADAVRLPEAAFAAAAAEMGYAVERLPQIWVRRAPCLPPTDRAAARMLVMRADEAQATVYRAEPGLAESPEPVGDELPRLSPARLRAPGRGPLVT